jgi:FtsH-binding integral membrane protein
MNTAVVIVVSVSLIAITLVMACCTDFFRRHALPLFIIFTLLMSLMVAMSICGFKSNIILMAAGITLVMTIALTIYACMNEYI